MKKLVIMIMALAIGASVNAASTLWKFSSANAANYQGTAIESGTVYLFMATSASDALADAREAMDALSSGGSISSEVATFAIGTNGKVASTSVTLEGSDSTTYYFRSVIVDGKKDYAYLSAQSSAKSSTSIEKQMSLVLNNSNDRGNWSAAGTTPSPGWYATVSSPEPTSGLLMLVGLGLLGLRRRRA